MTDTKPTENAMPRLGNGIAGIRPASITDHQAKYFAHLLTKGGGEGVERLQQSLLSASVDLNPHQVEAALFALRCPIPGGVLLSDEVGLGKTIEAGLVLCQLWAERKRRLLVLCPASLRKQWQCEIEDKFNLPCLVVDAKSARTLEKEGLANPYEKQSVLISSYPFGAKRAEDLRRISWDAVVFDEAHKLRNAYRESNKIGQALRWALEGRRKLLLTATPLQNSLTELYGIATLIDPDAFGDLPSFRSRYANAGGDPAGLYTLRRASPPPGATPYRPNTELGEWAVSTARALETPMAELAFDVTHHAGRISVVEALKGQSGFLRADVLRLKSLDAQDFVLVSAVTDDGKALDPEVAARFLDLDATASPASELPKPLADALAANAAQYASATAHAVGEANNERFREATERLARWSEDQIAAAAHRIEALRARRLEVERSIRQARTLDEQEPLQREFDNVRRALRRARTALFDVEDETDEKRKRLLDALRRRLVPETSRENLFTIRWKIV